VTCQDYQRVEGTTWEEWLFGNRADEGEAVGRAHSGDIVPTGAGGQGRVGAKGEIEEGAETKVPE